MMKRILPIFFAILMCTTLIACSNGSGPTSPEEVGGSTPKAETNTQGDSLPENTESSSFAGKTAEQIYADYKTALSRSSLYTNTDISLTGTFSQDGDMVSAYTITGTLANQPSDDITTMYIANQGESTNVKNIVLIGTGLHMLIWSDLLPVIGIEDKETQEEILKLADLEGDFHSETIAGHQFTFINTNDGGILGFNLVVTLPNE